MFDRNNLILIVIWSIVFIVPVIAWKVYGAFVSEHQKLHQSKFDYFAKRLGNSLVFFIGAALIASVPTKMVSEEQKKSQIPATIEKIEQVEEKKQPAVELNSKSQENPVNEILVKPENVSEKEQSDTNIVKKENLDGK